MRNLLLVSAAMLLVTAVGCDQSTTKDESSAFRYTVTYYKYVTESEKDRPLIPWQVLVMREGDLHAYDIPEKYRCVFLDGDAPVKEDWEELKLPETWELWSHVRGWNTWGLADLYEGYSQVDEEEEDLEITTRIFISPSTPPCLVEAPAPVEDPAPVEAPKSKAPKSKVLKDVLGL